MTIFQGRGRPQGNIDKTDLRLFPKSRIFKVWKCDFRKIPINWFFLTLPKCFSVTCEYEKPKYQPWRRSGARVMKISCPKFAKIAFFGYPLRHPLVLLGTYKGSLLVGGSGGAVFQPKGGFGQASLTSCCLRELLVAFIQCSSSVTNALHRIQIRGFADHAFDSAHTTHAHANRGIA